MKTIVKFTLVILLIGTLGSCKKWLNVTPTDQFSADVLLINKDGFLRALNGIYLELTDQKSYGENMSCGAIDVLAHYYHLKTSLYQHRFNVVTNYTYTDKANKAIFSNIWEKQYEMIANCNVLMEKMPQQPNDSFRQPYFNIIKGEALALRAFLHFDILRLFGPIWNAESSKTLVLPYALDSKNKVHPFLTATDYIDLVIKDLEQAKILLENDPIITEGVKNMENPTADNSLNFRQYRFNYFAVKTLLARAYLWKMDRAKAYTLSKEIISEINKSNIFPFVTNENATSNTAADRMFSTEVIFSLYDSKRMTLFNNLFSSSLNNTIKLSFNQDNTSYNRVNELYDDENDYRRSIWQLRTDNSITSLTNVKFEFIAKAPDRFMIPLIRISELYLIAAETAPNLEEAKFYLNTLRKSRNTVDLNPKTADELKTFIGKEYRKEFLGEGQTFFYFKRTKESNIPRSDELTGTINMSLNNYVVPLPDSEISVRVQ